MTARLNEIVSNAKTGNGPCSGCPAHSDTGGQFVNPGLLNHEADLMFLTMDPSHYIDWNSYANWSEYNADKGLGFKNSWRGGKAIRRVLSGVPGFDIDDVWLADAVKCPVDNDRAGDVDTAEAFAHCASYLRREIEDIRPVLIVTMGNHPAEQLLNGIFKRDVGSIKAGTRDCGTIYHTSPPTVVSPHWSNGWLGRHGNRENVQDAMNEVLGS